MNMLKSAYALNNEYIAKAAPSILADNPAGRCSSKYTYIPTIDVVEGMRKEGWMPVAVGQSRVRDEAREGFQKHLVRFRHIDQMQVVPDLQTVVPEIVLKNSHDGSGAYQLMAGLFRFVCTNGMVVADSTCNEVRVAHKGDVVGRVIEGAYEIVKDLPVVMDKMLEMRAIPLLPAEQTAFARAALPLRWEDPEKAGITPEMVLRPRRRADTGQDLWSTFQRVQESMIKGGMSTWVKDAHGRNRRSTPREVRGIDQSVKLNQALWTLAEEMKNLKGMMH